MTAKQIAGYLKARRDQRGSTFGGITFNDGYNVPTFGITKAAYDAIHRAMHAEYGTHAEPTNLTPAVVKKALSNHPISERSGARHATKKKAAGRSKKIKISTSRPIGWTITDPARPGWSETGTRTSDELREAFQPKRHHATKKSPAQLQREIDEALTGASGRSKYHLTPSSPKKLFRFTKSELEAMPTISQGHFENLKVEGTVEGIPTRWWLTRMTVEDGERHAVHVEQLIDGRWQGVHKYGRADTAASRQ